MASGCTGCAARRLWRYLSAAWLLLLFVFITACGPDIVSPDASVDSCSDIAAMIENGAYFDARAALNGARLTPEDHSRLSGRLYLAMARDQESAKAYSAAYGYYISAGTSPEAVDGAARCYAATVVSRAQALFDQNDIYGAYAVLDAFGNRAYADSISAAREAGPGKAGKATCAV